VCNLATILPHFSLLIASNSTPLVTDHITVTHHSVATANTSCSSAASCNREERVEKSVGEILSSVVVEIVSNKGEIWILFMLRRSVFTFIICLPFLPSSLRYSSSCRHPLKLLLSPPLPSLLFSSPLHPSTPLFFSPRLASHLLPYPLLSSPLPLISHCLSIYLRFLRSGHSIYGGLHQSNEPSVR
jgi:hypothetical protein